MKRTRTPRPIHLHFVGIKATTNEETGQTLIEIPSDNMPEFDLRQMQAELAEAVGLKPEQVDAITTRIIMMANMNALESHLA